MTRSDILHKSFSEDFVRRMKDAVTMSHFKYGLLADRKKPEKDHVDELRNAIYRLKLYEKTGNTEYLVDAANFLMFEYMEMKGHFLGTDNDPDSVLI